MDAGREGRRRSGGILVLCDGGAASRRIWGRFGEMVKRGSWMGGPSREERSIWEEVCFDEEKKSVLLMHPGKERKETMAGGKGWIRSRSRREIRCGGEGGLVNTTTIYYLHSYNSPIPAGSYIWQSLRRSRDPLTGWLAGQEQRRRTPRPPTHKSIQRKSSTSH